MAASSVLEDVTQKKVMSLVLLVMTEYNFMHSMHSIPRSEDKNWITLSLAAEKNLFLILTNW